MIEVSDFYSFVGLINGALRTPGSATNRHGNGLGVCQVTDDRLYHD